MRSTPTAGAGEQHNAVFSAFAFTSPLTILLLVHLGISVLAAASDLTFRITLYILLKLAVVPAQPEKIRKEFFSSAHHIEAPILFHGRSFSVTLGTLL
jgi:hypothetical protein